MSQCVHFELGPDYYYETWLLWLREHGYRA